MQFFSIDEADLDRILQAAKERAVSIEGVVNEVLHEQAGPLFEEGISRLLPESGRTWRRKKKAAKSSKPFVQIKENLAITIGTKSDYHYLYFPNDGSNTKRHMGDQNFMGRGVEEQKNVIMELIMERITKTLEGE